MFADEQVGLRQSKDRQAPGIQSMPLFVRVLQNQHAGAISDPCDVAA